MEETNMKETTHPCFVVFSNKTTNELKSLFSEYVSNSSSDDFSDSILLRVHFKQRNQTNTTFLLTNEYIGNILMENSQYIQENDRVVLKRLQYKVVEDPIRELFIPFPRGRIDPMEANTRIKNKLKHIFSVLNIPGNSVSVIMRKKSRIDDGQYKNFCIVKFDDSLNQETINIIKVMLHDSQWGSDMPNFRVRCIWSKKEKKNTE